MTTKILTAETAAPGTVLASDVTVGGDAPDLISKSGGGNFTVSNAPGKAGRGTQSVRLDTTGATDTAICRFDAYAGTTMAVQFTLSLDTYPSATTLICQVRHASGPIAALQITSAGILQVTVTSSGTVVYSTPSALAANTVLRIGLFVQVGTTVTDGTVKAAVYANPTTPATLHSFASSSLNTGTAAVSSAQIGKVTGAGAVIGGYFDDFRVSDGVTDLLPPEASNVAPTANAGADQSDVEPWATVTLTGTDSDSDGTIASRAWTKGGVTLATTATYTFEATATIAGITETYTYTVTDDDGATTTDSMTVAVLPVTERAVIGGVEVPMRIRVT